MSIEAEEYNRVALTISVVLARELCGDHESLDGCSVASLENDTEEAQPCKAQVLAIKVVRCDVRTKVLGRKAKPLSA